MQKLLSELQVLVMVVTGPLALAWKAAESVRSASSTLWQGLKPIGKVAKSASGLVRTTSLAATSSGASMADMTQQVSNPHSKTPRRTLVLLQQGLVLLFGRTIPPLCYSCLKLSTPIISKLPATVLQYIVSLECMLSVNASCMPSEGQDKAQTEVMANSLCVQLGTHALAI